MRRCDASLLSVATDGSRSKLVAPDVPAEQSKVLQGKLYWSAKGEDSRDIDGYDQDTAPSAPLLPSPGAL